MELTMRHYGQQVQIAIDRDDLSIWEMRDELLIPLLAAMGYSPALVEDLFALDATVLHDPIDIDPEHPYEKD